MQPEQNKYMNISLALLAGVLVGSIINMTTIMLGSMVVPPPEGMDMSTTANLRDNAELLRPEHYIAPLFAHALGTFLGALLAVKIAQTHKTLVAYIVGFVFLAGGITAVQMIPAPVHFVLLDLILAYIPMAYLANRVGHTGPGN